MEFIIALLISGLVCGAVGYFLGNTKGRGPLGALMGFAFGPIGWIVVLLLPEEKSDGLPPGYLAKRGELLSRHGIKTPQQIAKEEAWRKAQMGE